MRRSTSVRKLAILWAALQFASPGASAIADGMLAAANAAGPTTHVEATTTASCPVVHSPDCGVCRYLSGPADMNGPSAFDARPSAEARAPRAEGSLHSIALAALPHGRAPPVA
ncbi:MAG: hypothetical protein ACRENU_02700 [Gemmatimonadaceae bacterium]